MKTLYFRNATLSKLKKIVNIEKHMINVKVENMILLWNRNRNPRKIIFFLT